MHQSFRDGFEKVAKGKKEVGMLTKALDSVKNYHKGIAEHARQAWHGKGEGGAELTALQRAGQAGLAALKSTPHALAAGGGAYGIHSALSD